jgi:hypothetical protein
LSPEGSNGSAYKARAPNSGGRRSVARSDTGSSEYPGSSMAPTPGSVASGLSSVATTRRAGTSLFALNCLPSTNLTRLQLSTRTSVAPTC